MTVDIETREQQSHLLGRQKVHDDRSRGFAMPRLLVDRSLWRDKAIRIYDPIPNPNQSVGNCTMCAKAMQMNAVGNRRTGVVLKMPWAMRGYEWETANDEFPGQYKPDDTGSSGLASCRTAQHTGDGGEYRWIFGGADEVVQNVMEGRVVSVGTWWYESMFDLDASKRITVSGAQVGGHQYPIRGYDKSSDRVLGRCWWGDFRDFWMKRTDLDNLLLDGGDAHWQARA